MQQFCTYGSVRGASGNWRPYRDRKEFAAPPPCEKRAVPLLVALGPEPIAGPAALSSVQQKAAGLRHNTA
jgi:hypothetical protein